MEKIVKMKRLRTHVNGCEKKLENPLILLFCFFNIFFKMKKE